MDAEREQAINVSSDTRNDAGTASTGDKNTSGIEDYNNVNLEGLGKTELIKFVENCTQEENPLKVSRKVSEAKDLFLSITESEEQEALDKFLAEGHDKIDFSPKPDPEKEKFFDVFNTFKTKKNEFLKARNNDLQTNLKIKKEIIEKLKSIVNSEVVNPDHKNVNALQEKWKKTGPVPRAEADNINKTYHLYLKKYYASLDVYSQFIELDRKKNLDIKEHICEKIEALIETNNISNARHLLRKYQDEWKKTGPVPLENDDALNVRYQNAVTHFYEMVELYEESLEKEKSKHLETKEALLDKIEKLSAIETDNARKWIETNDKINELIETWKTIGPVPSVKRKEIEEKYRELIKTFNKRKNQFFKDLKKTKQQNLQEKIRMCETVENIPAGDDLNNWKNTVMNLQKQWKTAGAVPKHAAKEINKRFNDACDTFFQNLTKLNESLESKKKEIAKKKEAFIADIEKMEFPEDDPTAIKETVHKLKEEWSQLGEAPQNVNLKLNKRFATKLKQVLNKITGKSDLESDIYAYQIDLEGYLNLPNAQEKFDVEARKLNKNLRSQQHELENLRNNIAMFNESSNFGEQLKKQYENKIEQLESQITRLEKKLKVLRKIEKQLP